MASASADPFGEQFSQLSLRERLLVSQAVYEVGTGNLNAVSDIVATHPLVDRPEGFFSPEACQAYYRGLMDELGQDVSAMTAALKAPHAAVHLKLARKHWRERVEEVRGQILEKENTFRRLYKEIEDIRAGRWDERILADLRREGLVPSSPRAMPAVSHHDVEAKAAEDSGTMQPREPASDSVEVSQPSTLPSKDPTAQHVPAPGIPDAEEEDTSLRQIEELLPEAAGESFELPEAEAQLLPVPSLGEPSSEPLSEPPEDAAEEQLFSDVQISRDATGSPRVAARAADETRRVGSRVPTPALFTSPMSSEHAEAEADDVGQDVQNSLLAPSVTDDYNPNADANDSDIADESDVLASVDPDDESRQQSVKVEDLDESMDEEDMEISMDDGRGDGVLSRRQSKRKASEALDSPFDSDGPARKRMRAGSGSIDDRNSSRATSRVPQQTPTFTAAQKRFQNVITMLHGQISAHRNGNIFHLPIKATDAPNYHKVVKRPMDLKTIKGRIKDGAISNSAEFRRDIYLMFTNALMFNPPDSDVYIMTEEMLEHSERQIDSFLQTEGFLQSGLMR